MTNLNIHSVKSIETVDRVEVSQLGSYLVRRLEIHHGDNEVFEITLFSIHGQTSIQTTETIET